MQLSSNGLNRTGEAISNVQRNIFCGGDALSKKRHILVQKGVIKRLNNQIIDQPLQGRQIANHSGAGVDSPTNRDIHQIVVTMAMGPSALAVDLLVFFLTQLRTGQTVRRCEVGTNCLLYTSPSPRD